MTLSEAAQRLLAGRVPGAVPPPDPAEPTEEVTEEQQAFRDRAAAEDARFQRATDTGYWMALCFRDPEDPARFLAAIGLAMPADRFIPGPDLEAAIGERPALSPAQRVKQLLAARATKGADTTAAERLAAKPLPDPIQYEPTGDVEADSVTELTTLLAALQAPPSREHMVDVLDSPHWFAAFFEDRPAKDQFLAATGLEVLGDKYLDGHQAARVLNLTL